VKVVFLTEGEVGGRSTFSHRTPKSKC